MKITINWIEIILFPVWIIAFYKTWDYPIFWVLLLLFFKGWEIKSVFEKNSGQSLSEDIKKAFLKKALLKE